MKKFFTILMACILALTLAGCGSASPSDAADQFFRSLKNLDQQGLQEVYAGDNFDDVKEQAAALTDSEISKELQKKLMDMLLAFDYEIGEETVSEDGNTAVVEVKITAYEMGTAFTNAMGSYVSQAFGQALSGSSATDEAALEKLMEDILIEEMEKLGEEKTYAATVQLDMEKSEDGWKVSALDEKSELIDAVTGGLVGVIQSLGEAFA